MFTKMVLAAAVSAMALAIAAPSPADANGGARHRRVVKHRVAKPIYPAYNNFYFYVDPYQYEPSPRGYYPYYASAYWVPRAEMRYRYRYNFCQPCYFQAWGYPLPGYNHRAWHARHHGYHHRWHW